MALSAMCRTLSQVQGMEGTLPAELDRLTALTHLNANGEGFTGTLPSSWGTEGGFAELQVLSFGGNQLSGTLPSEWGAPDR